jgi:hypothetical protein
VLRTSFDLDGSGEVTVGEFGIALETGYVARRANTDSARESLWTCSCLIHKAAYAESCHTNHVPCHRLSHAFSLLPSSSAQPRSPAGNVPLRPAAHRAASGQPRTPAPQQARGPGHHRVLLHRARTGVGEDEPVVLTTGQRGARRGHLPAQVRGYAAPPAFSHKFKGAGVGV